MQFNLRTVAMATGFAILIATIAISCRQHKMDDRKMTEKNINYPAAYIVNGESNTLSVIKLQTNTLTDTIELMGPGADMPMWPHHIYQQQQRLAVGVPGMDLSEGHAGGMAGMKGKVLVLDALKGTVVKDLELPAMNHNATFSPNGLELWTSQMETSGKVLVYDASSWQLKNTINVGKQPAEVTFSADGLTAYVTNQMAASVSVVDVKNHAVIKNIAVGKKPNGIVIRQ
ncbi:hypothetical protein [Paraflavitalea sp. CAU 1676]|uniref:YncE family protein n=1 Tax=Paraflavitalea sp. CAU 1676 TaxID=3032598 RepID=UPI0023D9D5F3|nr:hypothetical protein [Paraflavitalea sp. CAU 1676]MDF2191650.1 hypothetical protein [Paraflavitalea sp. CAU 1676]